MFERELAARCLHGRKHRERTEREMVTCNTSHLQTLNTPRYVALCHLTSSPLAPRGGYAQSAPFFALMWPGAERGLHLECVGPSIIPLCKYLHKETGLLPLAKTGESIRGALFFSAIYSYDQREREGGGDRIQPREAGGGREERGQIKGRRTRGTVGTESGKKLRQMDGAGSGVKMKVKRSSEEENIRGVDDVMSSCGPGSPQTTAQAQMLLNEA